MTDFSDTDDSTADFGDAFDALPDLDLGDPMVAALRERKARLARALVDGETGVQYEALALFAEPLFTLYDIDPAEAFTLRADPDGAAEESVALLETARVLWAFFAMPPAERSHKRQTLAAQLVAEDPSEDDWMSLDALLNAAEIHWQALLPEEVTEAQRTGHPTLDFDRLLHHPAFHLGDDDGPDGHPGFGPDELSEVEARALFAQSLLDDVGPDEEAFEDALARADAYWDLAQEDDPLAAARSFAEGHDDRAAVLDEATRMIERYRALFPEHADR